MDARTRHEASIKRLNSPYHREFDKALDRVVRRLGGLDFFNDAQIALIREDMILEERDRQRRNRENRAESAWMAQQERLMSDGGVDDSAYRRDMIAAGRGHLIGR